MPPGAVRTVRDVIFWQYAKIISESADFGKVNYGFIMSKFKELQSGKIKWSSTVREWVKEHEKPNECIYCGSKKGLTVEHILPRCCKGPDSPDNVIMVCKRCNSSKGGKRLYEWVGSDRKDDISRIAEGKYLKLLYELHEKNGTLETSKDRLGEILCPECDLRTSCIREGHEGKLTVYCLEGIFSKN
jgi:hypothetical protein